MNDIAAAMHRVERILQRRPNTALQEDSPALATWQGSTRIVATHPSGAQMTTDMPAELGGSGDQVSPGWLLRAALSSCLATCIAMNAAARGIVLTHLEVRATSRSDTRGLLGMTDTDSVQVSPAPRDVEMCVSLTADGASVEDLHMLVADSQRCSPISSAVVQATPIAVHVGVLAGVAD